MAKVKLLSVAFAFASLTLMIYALTRMH